MTKSLAEDLVNSYHDKFHITIVRPSIIIGAISEPLPGWIESYSGPASLVLGVLNGIFRTVHCDSEKIMKFVPVDVAVNATIVATCKRTMMSTNDVFYCNITDSPKNTISWGFFVSKMIRFARDYPVKSCLWYPNVYIVSNDLIYRCVIMFTHFIPCFIFDKIGVAGKKIKCVKLINDQFECQIIIYFI